MNLCASGLLPSVSSDIVEEFDSYLARLDHTTLSDSAIKARFPTLDWTPETLASFRTPGTVMTETHQRADILLEISELLKSHKALSKAPGSLPRGATVERNDGNWNQALSGGRFRSVPEATPMEVSSGSNAGPPVGS